MPRKPKTPLQMAYLKFRAGGLSPAEAKEKAKKMVTRFEQLKRQKETGFTSSEAFQAMKLIRNQRRVQRMLLGLDPNFKIKRAEAMDLIRIYRSPDFRKILKEIGGYPINQLLKDYAQLRFVEGKLHPTSPNGLAKFFAEMLRRKTGKVKKSWVKIISGAAISHKVRPEFPQATEIDFFIRIEREKGEHLILNQHKGLEMLMIAELQSGEPSQKFGKIIEREVRNLRQPVSSDLVSRLINKIPDFHKKPRAIQERIIQEARATTLGERIANALREQMTEELQMEQLSSLWFRNGASTEGTRYSQWVLACLARHGNRKFLAQKAIEWFSRTK